MIEDALRDGELFQPKPREVLLETDAEDEAFEETTIEDASDAALSASSILATYLASSPYKVRLGSCP